MVGEGSGALVHDSEADRSLACVRRGVQALSATLCAGVRRPPPMSAGERYAAPTRGLT